MRIEIKDRLAQDEVEVVYEKRVTPFGLQPRSASQAYWRAYVIILKD